MGEGCIYERVCSIHLFLIRKLKDKLINPQTRELVGDLENRQFELKSRFSYLFSQLAEQGEKPFL